MADPVLVQAKDFTVAGGLDLASGSVTLDASATAGNVLVWIMAGDKNTGTMGVSDEVSGSTGWTVEVSLLSTSVSLYIAWKVTVGGEDVISFTWDGALSGNSSSGYAMEWSHTDSGVWAVAGKATNITNEVANFTISTGTTGTTTHTGVGIAAGAIDSINDATGGGTTWTNSYTHRWRTPSTSGGNAGVFVATLPVASGTTTSTSTTYTGTADQVSGAVVVLGKNGGAAGGGIPPRIIQPYTARRRAANH